MDHSTLSFTYQVAWQWELQRPLEPHHWTAIWLSLLLPSSSYNIQMAAYKVLYRLHYTPHRLRKLFLERSYICWKGCGTTGTFLHCFWSCPKVHLFWKQVSTQSTFITGFQPHSTLEFLILNLWEGVALDSLLKEFIQLLIAAAKGLLALYWKTIKIPNLPGTGRFEIISCKTRSQFQF